MKINIKTQPKTIEELEKIILLQKQEIENQKTKITAQQQEIISYKERYIRLLEEFKLEKHRRFSSSSEKNVYQSSLFDEAGVDLTEELKDQLDNNIKVESYTRKKHPVRRSIPKDIPREVIIHDIKEEEKICHCGSQLTQMGEEISEQIKYIFQHN